MNKILLTLSIILLASGNANAVDLPNVVQQEQAVQSISDDAKTNMTLEEKLAAKKAAVRAKMEAKKAELGVIKAENIDTVEISEVAISTPDTKIISEEIIENPTENAINNVKAAVKEDAEVLNETQAQVAKAAQNIENNAAADANVLVEKNAETVEEIQNQVTDEINQNTNNLKENAEQVKATFEDMEDIF